jgi:hypothetical protein
MNPLTEYALLYRSLGFSVVPVQANKRSLTYWKSYQQRIMPAGAIRALFPHPLTAGIGIVCGEISGNLLVIDIDAKNDLTEMIKFNFGGRLREQNPEIYHKLVIASTRNQGYHFFFRCLSPGRCAVLARRLTTDEERETNPNVKVKVLIETRAGGGYVIVYPTDGYAFRQGDLRRIATLSESERDIVLAMARSFNLMPDHTPAPRPEFAIPDRPGSPFSDYNARGNFQEILTNHGWVFVKSTTERIYFRRPGETDNLISGNYHFDRGLFTVFTSSTEFIPLKGYRPAAVYAILECQGNFTLAAKRLIDAGFGVPYSKMKP